MSTETFHIHHHPTDLTRRLLASTPGSTVTFTLEELLQTANYWAKSWPSRMINTGILTVYQMAAQHLDPSIAAQIALRATQYREHCCGMECTGCRGKGKTPGSHWRANQWYEGGKLCLRADPEEYPELPISCSSCIADGKECNVITKNLSICDPLEWDEEDDCDRSFECEHEDDCECEASKPHTEERPVIEIPDLLRLAPTRTLQELDEYFEKNPWGFPDSRDWGGGVTARSWNDIFLIHTGGELSQLGYYEDKDKKHGKSWVEGEVRERWIREVFGYFPGVIQEVDVDVKCESESSDEKQVDAQLQEEGESNTNSAPIPKPTPTWSIVIPRSISTAPFPLNQTSQPRLELPYDCPPSSPPPEPKSVLPARPGSLGASANKGKNEGKKAAAVKKQTQGKAGGSGGHAGGADGGGIKGGHTQAQAKGKGKKNKGKGGGGGKGEGRQSDDGWPKRET